MNMKKNIIPYGNHFISQTDIEAVIKVLKSDRLTTGPFVEQFEKTLQEKFGAKYVSVVSSGTAALHLAALALDWQKGDIVLTSPITFLATANCIIYTDSTPDFVDINLENYTIDLNKLEEKIKVYKNKGQKIKAVIAVDYAGHPCDWEGIRYLADTYEFQLINDNCHALGSQYNNDPKYAIKYADIVVQSFHPVKHITTGEGGAVITNNIKYDTKVRQLRTHGISYDIKRNGEYVGLWYREMVDLGYNYRLTDIQSALGISQLKKLDNRIIKRQELALQYDKELGQIDRFITPSVSNNIKHSYHLYALQIKFDELKLDKKEFFESVLAKGIQLQVHYVPIHYNLYYQKKYGCKLGDYPNSEKFYNCQISLPIYPELTDKELDYVIKCLIEETN